MGATGTYKSDNNYTADSMARKYGITVGQLQELNAGRNITNGIAKGVTINVPIQGTSLSGNGGGAPAPSPGQVTQQPQQSAASTQALYDQRNIAAALTGMFDSYGLGSLAPEIMKMIQQGMGSDEVTLKLQETDAYKQRFAANDARRKAGLPVLSPAEYISTERAYRQVMSAAGLPVGFYDSHQDFQKFLERDVSPTEVQARVQAASEAINNAPAGTLDAFKKYYNTGDLVAYALDPTKAEPLIEQRIKAAEAAATAQGQGVGIDQATAEGLAKQNLSLGQMQQGFGAVGADSAAVKKLNGIYGTNVTDGDLVAATFNSDAAATQKVKRLASQERATFGGSGAASIGSFSNNSGGQL